MMDGWRLAVGELRIPYGTGLAAHRMILVVDPRGHIARQLNGLASWFHADEQAWRHKPIGYLRTDRLRGYDTLAHPRTWMPVHGAGWGAVDAGPAILRGDIRVLEGGLGEAGLAARLAPGLAALAAVNAMSPGPDGGAGLPYPFLGFGRNSNSFYETLLAAMGYAPPPFATGVWLAPGRGRLLLSTEAMASLGAKDAHGRPRSGVAAA
jgi:hypothetical protein